MVNLVSETLPLISKEAAQHLRDRFRPIAIKKGIDRDDLMISCGEQRVIDYILANSVKVIETAEPEKKLGLFERFTNRIT